MTNLKNENVLFMKIYAQIENSVSQLSIYFKSQVHAFNKINSKPLLEHEGVPLDGCMPSSN